MLHSAPLSKIHFTCDCCVNWVHFSLPHNFNFLHSWPSLSLTVCFYVCICASRGGGGKWQGVFPCYLPHKGPSAQPTSSLRWGLAEHWPSALLGLHTGYLTSSLLKVRHGLMSDLVLCLPTHSLTTMLLLLIYSRYCLCSDFFVHSETTGQWNFSFLYIHIEMLYPSLLFSYFKASEAWPQILTLILQNKKTHLVDIDLNTQKKKNNCEKNDVLH